MKELGVDPVHDTRETFDALLSAIARPGTVHETPMARGDHAVIATLVDQEVGFFGDDQEIIETLELHGRLNQVPFEEAHVIHVIETTDGRIKDAKRGSLKEPSSGATVVYRVEGLVEERVGSRDDIVIELEGPGVLDTRFLSVHGLPRSEMVAIIEAQKGYPQGVDVVFTSGNELASLPRSVRVEVR